MKARTTILIGLALLLIPLFHLEAQIPGTLSYQAFLSDSLGVPKADGSYTITFGLYDVETGGTALWTETKDLDVKQGLFYTHLGPFPSSLRFDQPYWLGIQVGEELELTPRIPLTSVGYSFMALRSDSAQYATRADTAQYALLADSAQFAMRADTAKVATSALAAADLVDDAVTSGKIADGTIAAVDLADNAVTPAKIDTTGAATGHVLVYSGTSVAWQPPPISSGDITTVELADNAVTTLKLADNAVTSAKILDGAVGATDLADNAVTTAKILDGTVGTGDLADNAVTAAKILDGTVGTSELADNAVTGAKITDGTITGTDISASADLSIASLITSGTVAVDSVAVSSGASIGGSLTASALDVSGTVTAASLDLSSDASVGGGLTTSALEVTGTATADSLATSAGVSVGGVLRMSGGQEVNFVSVTADTTTSTSDRVILCTFATEGSITITLHSAEDSPGQLISIRNKNPNGCTVYINVYNEGKIDGVDGGSIALEYGLNAATLMSDGLGWWVISTYVMVYR